MACTVAAIGGNNLDLSYWDLWFAIVTADEYQGDLNDLAQHFREKRDEHFGREDAVRKLSHLRDLQQRLAEAGASVSTVLEAAGRALVTQERRRASGRVLRHNERQYERSAPMCCLPRDRLYPSVLKKMWPRFPVSPESCAERLANRFNWDRFYGENASHGLARKLDSETARAEKLLAKHSVSEALAMLRGLMTVAIELIAIADDSYGAIGDSFQEAFRLYLRLPWKETGIESEVFFADLVDFLVWEDHGFTYRQTDGYFSGLTEAEADFCLEHLRDYQGVLMALDLDYQAEECLTLVGQISAEQRRFEFFEGLAREMGTRAWHRIVLLADIAEKAGKHELAVAVLAAALTDGWHLDFLRRKYDQLIAGNWDPDPRK